MAHWRVLVEFEFEAPDKVTAPMYEGDAPIDFAQRAMQPFRQRLGKAFPGSDGVHWMMISPARATQGSNCVCIALAGAPHRKGVCQKPVKTAAPRAGKGRV